METFKVIEVILTRGVAFLKDVSLRDYFCTVKTVFGSESCDCDFLPGSESEQSDLNSEQNSYAQSFTMDMSGFTYLCHILTPVMTAVVLTKIFICYYSQFSSCLRQLKTHLEDWFFFLFTFFWLLYVSQPYALCVLWRWSVNLYMRLRYGSLGHIATGADSTGSLDTPESRQIIKSLKVLQGKCDITELRRRVQATACKMDPVTGQLSHPKFHQYLEIVGGFYCWRPSRPLDMSHHVRFADGLDEDSPSIGEPELLQIISQYSNKPFQEGRSLWEILVIPRLHYTHESDMGEEERVQKFGILVRISHGIGDGFSFLKLVMRDMAGVQMEEYVPPHKPGKRSSYFRRFCIFCYLLFKAPRAFYKELSFMDDNPLHEPEIEMSGEKVHAWSKPVDVEWLKELKTRLGTGMNTVLLNTLSSACRRYMITMRGMHESDLPQNIHAIIPVPAPNHPNNKLVNKFSILMLPLEISKSDSIRRCREIEKENKKMSTSPDCYLNLFLMDLLSPFHIAFSRYLIVNKQCTTVISNLPGPTKDVNIWGYPMVDTMFWLPNVGSSGVSVSYLSYGRKMRFGICVDAAAVPERLVGAELLIDWMIDDLKILAKSVNLPSDDSKMFINLGATISTKQAMSRDRLSPLRVDIRDKDEVGSEDFGYGGEPSDISSQDDISSQGDTDEDLEELTIKVREEIVGFKNKIEKPGESTKKGKKDNRSEKDVCDNDPGDLDGYSDERDVDQRFLMTNKSVQVTKTNSPQDNNNNISKRRGRGPSKSESNNKSNNLLVAASIC